MPPKKGTVWRPRGSQPDPRWLESAAERLDRVRAGLGDTSGGVSDDTPMPPASPDVEPSATSAAASSSQAPAVRRHMGVQPRGQPEDPAQELAALRLGRTSPMAFNPQRHAVMICGRPVVVQRNKTHCMYLTNHNLMSLPPQNWCSNQCRRSEHFFPSLAYIL